jgi:asparagine synthase (glutamine-hydrolysing)
VCGIAGFLERKNSSPLIETVEAMSGTMRHRGPDASGVWVDESAGLALGHRRLSVLDLSPSGSQPMASVTGRYVLSYNGEIYNYLEVRRELEQAGHGSWRGHSDTEVLLAGFEKWGIAATLQRLNGMFALATWDRDQRVLTLARDRLGEKPLYYGWLKTSFVFGSELSALQAHPDWRQSVDRSALAMYLRFNCVPAPFTIFEGIRKLPPATFAQVSRTDAIGQVRVTAYWSASDAFQRGLDDPYPGTVQDAEEDLDALLRDAVRGRMQADVPLGAFLSGGVDSTVVVAMMQAQSSRPVRTFSIGSPVKAYDEAPFAKAVAQHLGTTHTEQYVEAADALGVVPLLGRMYDEPFSDSSQIPTYLVSRLARQHVTVSLSGDGGDELFGGYNRYLWTAELWKKTKWMPRRARVVIAAFLRGVPPMTWQAVLERVPFGPRALRSGTIGDKIHKLAGIVDAEGPIDMYARLVSHWRDPNSIVLGAKEYRSILDSKDRWPKAATDSQQMMSLDLLTYLPDDILVKLDRASMAVSLEGRVPFLDHRVVEFAARLPLHMLIRGEEGKYLLRRVLQRYVPRRLTDRPKAGFGVPIDHWLRGPLREWAEALLSTSRLEREGYFDAKPIRERWDQHIAGHANWSYQIWDILMFQAWVDGQRVGVGERETVHCAAV